MFKTITLLKRKPGLSMAEFIDYYERVHAQIGRKYLAGRAIHYSRRFLHEIGDIYSNDKPYDVVMEIWFKDRASFETTFAALQLPEIAAEIAADEENLFDRAYHRIFVVEEHETDLGPLNDVSPE